MTVTTSYGTWVNHGDGEVDLETNVVVALGDHVGDFDAVRLAEAYRKAINDNLPHGVVLAGSEFYGPHPASGAIAAHIRDAIAAVDFWTLAQRFDRAS